MLTDHTEDVTETAQAFEDWLLDYVPEDTVTARNTAFSISTVKYLSICSSSHRIDGGSISEVVSMSKLQKI